MCILLKCCNSLYRSGKSHIHDATVETEVAASHIAPLIFHLEDVTVDTEVAASHIVPTMFHLENSTVHMKVATTHVEAAIDHIEDTISYVIHVHLMQML